MEIKTVSRARREDLPASECKNIGLKGIHITPRDVQSDGINPRKITATTIIGDKVRNTAGKELGKIEEIVFDLTCGAISYLVISSGGFAGIGDKFFAVPLDALTLDTKEKIWTLDIEKKALKKSSGFDKNNWPLTSEWPIDHH